MLKKSPPALDKFERELLTAVDALNDNAYNVSIVRKMEEAGGHSILTGRVFQATEALHEREFLASRLGEPLTERQGRSKIFYSITEAGRAAMVEFDQAHPPLDPFKRNILRSVAALEAKGEGTFSVAVAEYMSSTFGRNFYMGSTLPRLEKLESEKYVSSTIRPSDVNSSHNVRHYIMEELGRELLAKISPEMEPMLRERITCAGPALIHLITHGRHGHKVQIKSVAKEKVD